jgi:hypothetical protein
MSTPKRYQSSVSFRWLKADPAATRRGRPGRFLRDATV